MKRITRMMVSFIVYLCFVSAAFAKPVGILINEGITIALFDEPCALSQVSNLPYRATWTENGKTFAGCFSLRPDVGAVVAYFTDGSVALIPMQAFKPAKEA